MGNPNVGKSAVFSRLTGAHVVASNYPGTTVSLTAGTMSTDGGVCDVLDVPGTYTLEPLSPAEQVAVEMLRQGGVVVNVVDATNLERNLNLTLQLLQRDVPMVVALNMWDEALEHGIGIDVAALERLLGVPVVATCAISGEGVRDLQRSLQSARTGALHVGDGQRWEAIGHILEQAQKVEHRHPTIGQELSHATVHPVVGPLFAALVLAASFEVVRLIGEGLIRHVTDPAFERLWLPLMTKLSGALGSGAADGAAGLLHELLIGQLSGGGRIGLGTAFGLLTTGLYIPLGAVLPYVFAFYLVLGILEDTGYLPRLGVLLDTVMHRIGLHGLSVVPMLLGLGCNVPGILATRILETRKERFIAATLTAICVPCMASLAMVAGLVGRYGVLGFAPIFGTLALLWAVVGALMNRLVRGATPEILVDIPPYRMPYWPALGRKLWLRMVGFLREGELFVLLGVVVVNLLYSFGVIAFAGKAVGPALTRLLGLPPEAIGALLIGLLRKDVAVGMLAPLGLSLRQLVVASVVLSAYFPCVAAFVVLFRELGLRDMLRATAIMVVVAFSAGAVLNLLMAAAGA